MQHPDRLAIGDALIGEEVTDFAHHGSGRSHCVEPQVGALEKPDEPAVRLGDQGAVHHALLGVTSFPVQNAGLAPEG